MNRLVADASFCGAWILPDETSEAAERVLDDLERGRVELLVPALWVYEMLNLLKSAHRRGRIGKCGVFDAIGAIDRTPVSGMDLPDEAAGRRIGELALTHDLSAYDASYLELALRLKVPLRSADRALVAAARARGLDA